MPIFSHAQAWLEYGAQYAVHKSLWDGSVRLATLGPQPDRGDKARDFSGRGNHGTWVGTPVYSAARIRGRDCVTGSHSGAFGPTAYISFGNLADLNFGSGDFAVSVWFAPTAIDAEIRSVIQKGRTFSDEVGWGILMRPSPSTIYGFANTEYNRRSLEYASPVANTWYSVVLQRVGSYAYMYVHGLLAASTYIGTSACQWSDPCYIGYGTNTGYYGFQGNIVSARAHHRALSLSEINVIGRHPLAAYEVRLPEYFFGASTAVTLTVAGSAVDVTSDSPTLTQHNTLAVGNAVCSVTSGNVALVQHSALTVQSSQLATSSQSPALTQHNALTVADSKCVVSSETLALTQHSALTVQGSVCAVTAGNIALTQHATLTVQDCSVTLNSQSPELTQHSVLTIGNSQCAATSQGVALTQHNALACGNATCTVVSENVVLTAHAPAVVTLTVQGSTCVAASTSPSLIQHGALIVASSQCLVSSGNVTLAYHAAGAALILEHQTLLLAI